jgi:hypothetical protein
MIDESFGILAYNYDDIVAEGKLLSTTDGGFTWEEYSNNNFHFGITDIYFPSQATGWVADNYSEILYTSNAGATWDSLQNYKTLPLGIKKFKFIDAMRAWGINSSEILYTTDGWHTFNIIGRITSVDDLEQQNPDEFELSQNYPNPFNPSTKIKFTIPESPLLGGDGTGGLVTLKVHDILGNEMTVLVNKQLPAGTYEVEFDGTELPSGIYFYQLRAGSFVETKKMLLLK